jgi:hypothetical protein
VITKYMAGLPLRTLITRAGDNTDTREGIPCGRRSAPKVMAATALQEVPFVTTSVAAARLLRWLEVYRCQHAAGVRLELGSQP